MTPVEQTELFDAPDLPMIEISSAASGDAFPSFRPPARHPGARDHVWHPDTINPRYLTLQGFTNALVRTVPSPNGRYLWQFRKVASYADTVEQAKEFVEAGAEFFAVMHRNPYSEW